MMEAGLSLMICSLIQRRGLGGRGLAPLREGWAGRLALLVVVLGAEHRVGQRDGVDLARVGVAQQVGIDEERYREIGAFARPETLPGEAEALQLVEIDAGLERRDVEGRGAGDRRLGQVDRAVGDDTLL